MKFPESKLAHRYIDPLQPGPGLEVGGSAHNAWGIPNTLNVDYTDDMGTVYKRAEVQLCGEALRVDVVAHANRLPFPDKSYSWLINSHVYEHLPNPIGALVEWHRVIRHGGIIFSHVPHRDALPSDRGRPITTIQHLVDDWVLGRTEEDHPLDGVGVVGGHYHVFDVPLYLHAAAYAGRVGSPFEVLDVQEKDEKVGNSFVVVLRVI